MTSPEQNAPARDPAAINEMFGAIARRYDLANHILSCGWDFYWRKRASKIAAAWEPRRTPKDFASPFRVIDLATGTGDLAIALGKEMPDAEIIGADFSEEMLAVARQKGLSRVVRADVLALPFEDQSFDCVTIAFGLRNLQDWSAALREMARVLRSTGHILVLEFSLPRSSILRAIYRSYLHQCLPVIGSFLTKKKNAYDYLGDSIEEFPNWGAMLRLMEANGFTHAEAEPLTGGIVTIYTATRR